MTRTEAIKIVFEKLMEMPEAELKKAIHELASDGLAADLLECGAVQHFMDENGDFQIEFHRNIYRENELTYEDFYNAAESVTADFDVFSWDLVMKDPNGKILRGYGKLTDPAKNFFVCLDMAKAGKSFKIANVETVLLDPPTIEMAL